jgi:cell fate (sporulation/competence/biofilm development) regulator YmcA (YheA/YmcA/DUF963 family)
MNLKALRENSVNEIKHQKELAAKGEDFSATVIEDSKRLIWLVDEVAAKLTEEEWVRLQAGILGIRDDEEVRKCRDIKDKFGLSWGEMQKLRLSDGYDGVKKLNQTPQAKASQKYDKANTKQITFKFNLHTDADILEKLDSVPNRQGYIKELVRRDIG